MSSSLGVSLVWYRNDLRIRDHQGLSKAIDSNRQVVAYFNFNPNFFKELNIGFKKTGSYIVKVRLHREVNFDLSFEVVKEQK